MKYVQSSHDHFIVRLDPGDDIHQSVLALCDTEKIENAEVSGLGSVDSPKLAHYRKDEKQYSEKVVPGILEIASLIGNVALYDGKPLAHIHVVVSDPEMQAFAGHLVEGKCSATVELVVHKLHSELSKADDDEIGLKLWQL